MACLPSHKIKSLICSDSERKINRTHKVWLSTKLKVLTMNRKINPITLLIKNTYFRLPSPPIKAVNSSIRSSGKGGSQRGFIAILISFIGLSSAATLFDESLPHLLQRCIIAHSSFSYPNRYRFHNSTTVRCSISGFFINVKTGKTVRTMISMVTACTIWNYRATTNLTSKSIITRMIFIISIFIFLRLFSLFILFLHKSQIISIFSFWRKADIVLLTSRLANNINIILIFKKQSPKNN